MTETIDVEKIEAVKEFLIKQGHDPGDPNLLVWFNRESITHRRSVCMAREIASVLKGVVFPTRINDDTAIIMIAPEDLGVLGVKPEIIRNFFNRLDYQIEHS